jgi:hypothetical protein
MEFEDLLAVGWGGSDVDIAFFADADLVAQAEDGVAAAMGVEGEVVEAAIG